MEKNGHRKAAGVFGTYSLFVNLGSILIFPESPSKMEYVLVA